MDPELFLLLGHLTSEYSVVLDTINDPKSAQDRVRWMGAVMGERPMYSIELE